MNKKNVTIYKEAAQQTAEWIHTIRTGVSVLCSLSDLIYNALTVFADTVNSLLWIVAYFHIFELSN